jgi:RNA polymerase sigma-70 factor, ECF subfamily
VRDVSQSTIPRYHEDDWGRPFLYTSDDSFCSRLSSFGLVHVAILKPLKPLQPEKDANSNGGESPIVPSSKPPIRPASLAGPPPDPVEAEVIDLYQQNASGLFRFADALARDHEMAQDALQEAFLRYFVARSSGQKIQNGKSWLYRVVRNYLLDRLQEASFKNKASLEEAENIADDSADPEQEYLRALTRKQVLKVLAPRELECLQLRAEGFDYREIAQILTVRSGTVGATLARALNKIRKVLNPSGDRR